MPQLIPYYFVNQLSFTFLILIILIYILSKYILPVNYRLFLTRMFITKI